MKPPAITADCDDLAPLLAALVFAYSALDDIGNAPAGFNDRELRARALSSKVDLHNRLRAIDKAARKRARNA